MCLQALVSPQTESIYQFWSTELEVMGFSLHPTAIFPILVTTLIYSDYFNNNLEKCIPTTKETLKPHI